ncbi:NAD-glutamate dehydrogenase [Oryzihumus leptocrescens]|uniref:Glutamate dehydrogenase (NAD) n=1 Tax=Oryzihumus leptocrescens TaxID=297536 RepID=A0A542ZGJ2_9MICO|nr:NAD-glutamate dehydrogenase [Oryzihumus leptocrescens]TQL59462.1 glutamate dehydrogenase (NAD) [Oryzihumus leptocrescens]
MSASLEQSRSQLLRSAAELAERAGGEALERFLRRYYRHVATEDLLARAPEDLLGAALSHKQLAQSRPVGTANVRVFTPTVEEQGWSSGHTVIEIVTDDMPFLVDSVTAELSRQERSVYLVVHPQLTVRRDAAGELEEILDVDSLDDDGFGQGVESWMHVEVDRESDEDERAAIAAGLSKVLSDVREAVEDWPKMRSTCSEIAESLTAHPPVGVDPEEVAETRRLLTWLADNHFTFLGYREYALTSEDGDDVLRAVPSTGLGLLRYDQPQSVSFSRLTPEARAKARDNHLLIITKANSRATVHRSTYLDYVGVKTFDEQGNVTGERRFLGLFTSSAYTESVLRVPIIDNKVRKVLQGTGFTADSHSGKDLLEVLETYPRDELFQTETEALTEIATAVLHLQERRRTRLFLRRDEYGRFMSCLVYIPRDRYTTAVRLKMEALLRAAFHGASVDYTTRVSESVLARLHFVVRVRSGEAIPEVDEALLEQQIVDATRTWDEDLGEVARAEHGEEAAARLIGLYGKAFPEAYKEDFTPRVGIVDLRHIEALESADSVRLNLYQEPGSPAQERRFKLYRRGPLSLTAVLPLFTHLGVEVVDERPYEIDRADGVTVYVYDFGLVAPRSDAWAGGAGDGGVRELFQDAFSAVWDGRAESDGFNALVLEAGLTWRQVVILRAVAKYLRQTGSTFSQEYVEAALVSNVAIAAQLVSLFEARFDPAAGTDVQAREDAQQAVGEAIESALEQVASLDHDRIIRAFLGVIRATLRTNYFQPDADGSAKSYVSFKLDPKKVPDLPAPRPMFEIWVYSPRVEGVHLRFGKVARGGLRWSDRREDFRTEVLGLVKAQMVKNAVIVPTGSKGGFFAKALPDPTVDRDAWLAEGVASYKLFISGMLDVTDNLVGTDAVPPQHVVRHDEDDTYLVVAADKGTATFSDIANGVAQSYGFWLDDAFASGGSAGYDHKAMGITARGAWESVKRHFREMGVDTQKEDFTAVGVGDMSGDVFGNGMLLSEHIRLVAAFDHRHIFLDPDPVSATSFVERRRLFDLPRSSWADYDSSLISEGGGVFPRSAKAVPISEQAAATLGLPRGVSTMTPAELMKAILLAPVDLLWNGGIGTYVKASSESHADIGDRANDAIRVDGNALRCKVIGEGGNLGLSQLGRIEASFAGVRVNTDAIDNSAGVDTSDHEVNIKILLTGLMRDGDLTLKQRNAVLSSMTDEVAQQVLRDNYEQNVLLGNARAQEHAMLPVHKRLIHWLEERGDLDRELEFLPSDSEIDRRQDAGLGLKSPEFSVLVAYAKLALKEDLLPTGLPDDPWFQATLTDYFPEPIREHYQQELASHPLRREIVTNAVVNSMVNRGGITFAFRASEETGATPEQVARAYVVCREVFNLRDYVTAVEDLDNVVSTATQTALYLEFRRLLDRGVRWFLQNRPATLDVAAEVERFRGVVEHLGPQVPQLLQGNERKRLERRARELEHVGAPGAMATDAAGLLDRFSLLDVVEIAADTGREAAEVAPLYFALSERFGIDAMLGQVTMLPRDDRWDALARAALRDDLYAVLEALTKSVLEGTEPGGTPRERIDAWSAANAEQLSRARVALSGIQRLEHPGISALSVALRTLRGVIRSGAATV